MEKIKLVCKGCDKEITITNTIGSELLAVTSVLGHIMTCKELKERAEQQKEGFREFLKVFFTLTEE